MVLRLGCVPFLNAKPLIAGLEGRRDVRIVFAPPSRLAGLLRRGWVDAALLPVVDCFREPGFRPVAGVGIVARGKAGSVRLLLRRPVREVRTLALDRNSHTSNALARVWLAGRHGVRPRVSTWDPARTPFGRLRTDAAVVIGDNAFRPEMRGIVSIDLAEAWRRWTGLPFVFAVWAVGGTSPSTGSGPSRFRPGGPVGARRPLPHPGQIIRLLRAARDRGLRARKAIALAEGPKVQLSPGAAFRYLSKQLSYRAGRREERAVRAFRARCAEIGLCPRADGDLEWIR